LTAFRGRLNGRIAHAGVGLKFRDASDHEVMKVKAAKYFSKVDFCHSSAAQG
jgi:hypothetical protein